MKQDSLPRPFDVVVCRVHTITDRFFSAMRAYERAIPIDGATSAERAALKRASMDLTRALAELRRART